MQSCAVIPTPEHEQEKTWVEVEKEGTDGGICACAVAIFSAKLAHKLWKILDKSCATHQNQRRY